MLTSGIFNIHGIPGFVDVLRNNFDETLKINKVNYTTKSNESYSIIRYNKTMMTEELVPSLGMIKSIVFNEDLKAIGFAPPKSLNCNTFQKLYSQKSDFVIAEEFVDGVMINLFWNPKMNIGGGWEISTRNTVGGIIFCNHLQPKKTYADLFKEVIDSVNLDIHKLNKSYCYSFVMQHPDIHNIYSFIKPKLYLVEIYEIVQTLSELILVFQMNIDNIKEKMYCFKASTVKVPERYEDWIDYSDLKRVYASANTRYSCKGVILRNLLSGERSKILNPTHHYIKLLHRVGEKEMYKYLVMRKEGRVKEFLKAYPVEKKKWSNFREFLHSFTNELHENYMDCYVKKAKMVENIPKMFRTHVQELHEIYSRNCVGGKKNVITYREVIYYINTLPPDVLLFYLNYPLREFSYDSKLV